MRWLALFKPGDWLLTALGAYFAQHLFNSLRIQLNNTFEQKVICDLRSDIYERLQTLPLLSSMISHRAVVRTCAPLLRAANSAAAARIRDACCGRRERRRRVTRGGTDGESSRGAGHAPEDGGDCARCALARSRARNGPRESESGLGRFPFLIHRGGFRWTRLRHLLVLLLLIESRHMQH